MENKNLKILVVDDEPDILEIISYNLGLEKYTYRTALNGLEALQTLKEFKPNLILLDIMMPGIDGVEVCRRIRKQKEFKNTIIAFLTARSEDFSQIAGFEVGADDYIAKPVKPRVLMSRIKGLLRRHVNSDVEENFLKVGDIIINQEEYLLYKNEEKISLPRKEFALICLLASKPGKVFSRTEILNQIWGAEVIVGDRTIDVHIRKLREKLGDQYIKTVKGIGYKIDF